MRLADRIARNREILGLHYRSDSKAGKELAEKTVAIFKNCPTADRLFTPGGGGVDRLYEGSASSWDDRRISRRRNVAARRTQISATWADRHCRGSRPRAAQSQIPPQGAGQILADSQCRVSVEQRGDRLSRVLLLPGQELRDGQRPEGRQMQLVDAQRTLRQLYGVLEISRGKCAVAARES